MNDNDIIKALECCFLKGTCAECPLRTPVIDECLKVACEAALDLINRQKAEIDRLQKYNTDMARKHYSDGIKEFAEKLKANHRAIFNVIYNRGDYCALLDKLAGEMQEEADERTADGINP